MQGVLKPYNLHDNRLLEPYNLQDDTRVIGQIIESAFCHFLHSGSTEDDAYGKT